jgi:hypothetical protein
MEKQEQTSREAASRMEEIQRIMERATRYTLLPGTGAIVGGALVLAGCAASYAMFRAHQFGGAAALDFSCLLALPAWWQIGFGLMWLGIGVVAVVQEAFLARRAARSRGAGMSRPARLALYSLTPSVLVAFVLTAKLLGNQDLRPHDLQLVVPLWMMLYGTGVYTAGLFSVRLPRTLGLTFIGLGAVALLALPGYGVLTGALSFGVLHIAFGALILRRRGTEAA